MTSHLAPVARLFVTTKRRRCIEHVEGIDPNNTRLDLFRKSMCARDVARPNTGRQTVDRVVRLFNQIVFVFEANDRHHWSKDLLLGHAHAVLHFRKDRWTEEVTSLERTIEPRRLTTCDNGRAFLPSDIDVTFDPV